MTSFKHAHKKPKGTFAPAPKRPLIASGMYQATIRCWELHRQYDRTKILIQVDASMEDELIRLTYFVTTKVNEDGEIQEPTPTMKLYKMLKNLWPQRSFQDIDMDDLINMQCTILVETVTKDSHRQAKPSDKQYSAIREILPLSNSNVETTERDPWDEAEDDDIPF